MEGRPGRVWDTLEGIEDRETWLYIWTRPQFSVPQYSLSKCFLSTYSVSGTGLCPLALGHCKREGCITMHACPEDPLISDSSLHPMHPLEGCGGLSIETLS